MYTFVKPGADSEPGVGGSPDFGQGIRAKQKERGSTSDIFSNIDALGGGGGQLV